MRTNATAEKSKATGFAARKAQPFFAPAIVQPKLEIGPVDDPYEREADAVADKVMRMSDNAFAHSKRSPLAIQRRCAACEEEEKHVQMKSEGGAASSSITSSVENVLASGGQPMDAGTRSFMESRFGYDFGNVRIHNDAQANQSSSDIRALAYTHDKHVVFGAKQYQPNTNFGRRLLAHELTHTLQQSSGSPIIQREVIEPPASCPSYLHGEVRRSHSAAGILSSDVILIASDQLLVSDFSVASATVSHGVIADPLLVSWLDRFERNSAYRLNIKGYTDCVDKEGHNSALRSQRALSIAGLLGSSARSRVTSINAAPPNEYVLTNTSDENRARNRGVLIEFIRHYDMDEPIEVHPRLCGPDVTQWLIDQMKTNVNHPVIRTARK